ncbi:MAG: pyridoxamine 5'-phosphate oxidase [Prolixibacteraceae bacterium]|nr:pyridoxamine 5'-phosphate oxidase [Prolixibacteraceae bacterium]
MMLRDIRTNYEKSELLESGIKPNPFEQLRIWLAEAISGKETEPTAMVLSTIDAQGFPESRVVLLKELKDDGLVFYTNYESKKGNQIAQNGHVAVVLFWPQLERQVRIKGIAKKISEEESTDYFKSRPADSQLGAWASPQSQVIENREVLDENYRRYKEKFKGRKIEKPPHWGGYIIMPEYFEFWQGRSNRLHDRLEYLPTSDGWKIQRLAP